MSSRTPRPHRFPRWDPLGGHALLVADGIAPAGSRPDRPADRELIEPAGAEPSELLPLHLAEHVTGRGIPAELVAVNVASFGPGTCRHWENERAELVAVARRRIQTDSTTAKGSPQIQPGHLADRLIRLDQRYRHLAEGGWRSTGEALPGFDPFHCWKPNRPRFNAERGRSIKYEQRPAAEPGLFLPRYPDAYWRKVCSRYGLPFPADRAAGFWAWVLAVPAVPLTVTEGFAKALAAASLGLVAVGLPGVQMGRRVDRDGSRTVGERLIPELATLATKGRRVCFAFDAERKPTTARTVELAAIRTGLLLRRAGCAVTIARLPLLQGAVKTGLDDLLVTRGAAAVDLALSQARPVGPGPVVPRLRPADQSAPAGERLHDAAPIPAPEAAPLVAVEGAMGSGKTFAVGEAIAPHLDDGTPTLNLTHRVTLGQAQSEAWGLPWAAAPGSDERLQGTGACWDSCCPDSGLQIRPSEWSGPDGAGPVVVLDEVGQGVEHLLLGHGTALAERRPAVLRTVAELLRSARQTIACDAQLSDPVLQLLEALTGKRAHLIQSLHRPMAGRRLICPLGLTAAEASKRGRGKVLELIEASRPFFCWSSCQTAGSRNSPQNLARLHLQRRPAARVLVIDSEHPEAAAQLAADPDGVAARFDAIYCSPSIASGLSIDLRGRFDAVVVLGGGTVGPEHLAQAAARVRDPGAPVFMFCPERSPGGALKIGSGDTDPAALLRHLRRCEAQLLADLSEGWDPMAGASEAPWLRCWLELAALRNRQRLAYASTAVELLAREGWAIETPADPTPEATAAAAAASDDLAAIATAAQAAEDLALIEAEPLTDAEAQEIERKRHPSQIERAQIKRHKVARRWGLGANDPTAELLQADRQGLSKRRRFGWLLESIEGRQLAARHDARRREQLAPDGQGWAPDLVRELLGHKIAAADALGLPGWLSRSDWFSAADPELIRLQATAEACRGDLTQALGIGPAKRGTTTLRALLGLAGFELEKRRSRGTDGNCWRYRIRPAPLPAGANPELLRAAWVDQLTDPGG